MATKADHRGYLSQLKSVFRLTQRLAHTLAEGKSQKKINVVKDSTLQGVPGQHDIARWKKVDARTLGITSTDIPQSPWFILKILRYQGFKAYLVGGCVRDLILKRTPKDFDVITTAGLKEIRRIFHNARIVGRRFPICHVNMKGCIIEVSSFTNDATKEKEKSETHPKGCSNADFVRWRDCTRRDFTINSMFYDPFDNKVYDYANAMMDLKSLTLRTLTPAHMSFTEDCARILRGLRIAARLDFSLSKETKAAIREHSPSLASLSMARLMMELNYMLAYGAAERSLYLLRRFKVLEIMLPFHDAYLLNHRGDLEAQSSSMLMRLFSSLDKVVTCGQPCDSLLWIGLLAFHMALVTNPQQSLRAWTFSAVLYYGNWNEGVKAARQHAFDRVDFEPEILKSFTHLSDEELAKEVSKFASIVQDSIVIMTNSKSLHNAILARYPSAPSSVIDVIPKRFSAEGARLLDIFGRNIQSLKNNRESYEVNHMLLGKGNISEVRFVLGKIIIDTLSHGVVTDKGSEIVNESSFSPSNVESPIKKETLVKKLASSTNKKAKENTVHQEQAELTLEPIKKQKEENEVMKQRKVSQITKKKPKENTVNQEQAELAPKPIKKEKLIQKEQDKVKEGKVSQILSSSTITKPSKKNEADEKSVVKERENAGRLSRLFK